MKQFLVFLIGLVTVVGATPRLEQCASSRLSVIILFSINFEGMLLYVSIFRILTSGFIDILYRPQCIYKDSNQIMYNFFQIKIKSL